MTETQAKDVLGKFVPARRFGIKQDDKFRPIDDYSMPGTNALVAVEEKPCMQNLDVVFSQTRCLHLALCDGHLQWHTDGGVKLKGRTIDFDSANRQLG
eukprot:2384883-Amphidinium_carterae.1